jgi:hypothetical protein
MPAQRIFSGFRDHRQPFDVAKPVVSLGSIGALLDFGERAGRKRVAQARITTAEALVQGEHAIAAHHAEARLAVGNIARKLHSRLHTGLNSPRFLLRHPGSQTEAHSAQ